MSAFSDQMAAVARGLITEFGETCTFTRKTLGTYDPNSGSTVADTETTFSSVCFQEAYKVHELDGSLSVERGDIKLLVAPVVGTDPSEPSINDVVSFSGLSYRVLHVEKVTTNAATVLFILQVRQ